MAIEISNNGASLKIKSDTQVRNIMKAQVQEIVVVKGDIIKIDIGKGALYNVFIQHSEVTIPIVANAEALRNAINEMMLSSASVGSATEVKQSEEIDKLSVLNEEMATIRTTIHNLDRKMADEPASPSLFKLPSGLSVFKHINGTGHLSNIENALSYAGNPIAWLVFTCKNALDVQNNPSTYQSLAYSLDQIRSLEYSMYTQNKGAAATHLTFNSISQAGLSTGVNNYLQGPGANLRILQYTEYCNSTGTAFFASMIVTSSS